MYGVQMHDQAPRGTDHDYSVYDIQGRPLFDRHKRPISYADQQASAPRLTPIPRYAKTSFKGRKVSPLGWCTFAVAFFAFLLTLLSFGIPLWATTLERDTNYGDYTAGYGIWHRCSRSYAGGWERCNLVSVILSEMPDWYRGAQAMASFGLITSFVSVMTAGVYIFIKSQNRRPVLMVFIMVISTLSGLIQTGLAILFGIQFLNTTWGVLHILSRSLSFCFGIGIAGGVLSYATAVSAGSELRTAID